ncbi:DUF192 domain-containing protein [Rheinheimera sp. WS51]|uniref:DUF192 domain-containing protein n=1 Tax=Rheinheimera sp. WS51 TaxID=3425886 RepID=UPI003D89C2F7
MLKSAALSVLILLICPACAAQPSTEAGQMTEQEARQAFSLAAVNIGKRSFIVQLADSAQKRAQGLMFQKTANPGMLLLYKQPDFISLWMRNTTMPLDVAFIGPDWTILHIEQLQPLDETSISSNGKVIAALEMPQGWFAAKQIKPGDKVKLITN